MTQRKPQPFTSIDRAILAAFILGGLLAILSSLF